MTDTAESRSIHSASEIARRIAVGSVSAVSVIEATIARIEAHDCALSAFCTKSYDVARNQAGAIDLRISKGLPVGPLAGVPVAIKDLIPTRGIRTTFGSLLYADHVPDSDDVVVRRLRHAGALIVGKTNTSEFGYGPVSHNQLFPPTRNPWNPDLSPGGSSAGSAAAVAAGMVPLAVGSDGGGSIRVPAALCGVFGFKPSFGRIPIYPSCRDERMPGVSGWESLEHFGPIATCIDDLRLFMAVAAQGPDHRDRHSISSDDCRWLETKALTPEARPIAYSASLGFASCDPEIDQLARAALEGLVETGWMLSPQEPTLPDAQQAFEAIVAMDTDRKGLKQLLTERRVTTSNTLSAVLDHDWRAEDFNDAVKFRKHVSRMLGDFFEEHSFLVTPTVAATSFELGQDGPRMIAGQSVDPSAWTPFSSFANLAGCPAISVPVGLTRAGLPVGIQIMGRHLDDIGVLDAAQSLEAITPPPRLPQDVYPMHEHR